MPMHVDDESIIWGAPDFLNRQMRTKFGDAYATWYGEDGWRNEIQVVPIRVEIGETDARRYAVSAREALRRTGGA